MDAGFDLATAWLDAQAQLPDGWALDSLRCASTGLASDGRSDDWVAVAVGPGGEERRAQAADPVAALSALARSIAKPPAPG
jgi:hypothetical protein